MLDRFLLGIYSVWPAAWSRQRKSSATMLTSALLLIAILWTIAIPLSWAPEPIGNNAALFAQGTRMTVDAVPASARLEAPQSPRTLAQELFGCYVEPRPGRSGAPPPRSEPAAPWRRDQDAVTGLDRDLDGRGQPF